MSLAAVTFAPGRRVGNYEMLVELAAGGTATVGIAVYRGAAGFERLVVIKRMHRHLTRDREFMAMLLDEARLASSIRHPNVVPVIDVVQAEDEVMLVMDYVESVSLAQLVAEGERCGEPLPLAVASRILCDVLEGLQEAHDAVDLRRRPLGIVHRDVGPQNIVVGVDGVSRVIDFGIAQAKRRMAHTRAGNIKGKCAYMAPEQVDGQAVDRRCDVFAAGIVLWEALTGKRLFRGNDEFDEMRRVMRAPVPAPSSVSAACGPEVDALLARALARPVEERFQSARDFARALEQTLAPAPASVVREYVQAMCAAELEHRHGRLQALLGEELDKLSPRPSSRAPAPLERVPAREAPALDPKASAEPRIALPHRPLTPTLIVVTLLSLVAGAGAATVWLSHAREGARAQGAATASAPSVAAAGTGAANAPSPANAPAPATAPANAPAPAVSTPLPSPRTLRHAPASSPAAELKSNPYQR